MLHRVYVNREWLWGLFQETSALKRRWIETGVLGTPKWMDKSDKSSWCVRIRQGSDCDRCRRGRIHSNFERVSLIWKDSINMRRQWHAETRERYSNKPQVQNLAVFRNRIQCSSESGQWSLPVCHRDIVPLSVSIALCQPTTWSTLAEIIVQRHDNHEL